MEVQLRDGDRFRGLLAFSSDEVLVLEVEGHLRELRRREVVSERYLDQDPAWLKRVTAPEGPLEIERAPLPEGGFLEATRQAFGKRARVVFLPSRAPRAWSELPDEANPEGPFPLWDPVPELPLECVPHVLAFDSTRAERPWAWALMEELGGEDLVVLESEASPLALAGFLGQLRWAYVGGRALGLRFYDPRVLGDLWEHLDPPNLGLLFGGVWTRDDQGREDLRCVLCTEAQAALSLQCDRCGGRYLGDEGAPTLLGAQARVEGRDWVVARPQAGFGGGSALARPQRQGRQAFWLPPSVAAAIGQAYRRRVEGGESLEASSGAADAGAKT